MFLRKIPGDTKQAAQKIIKSIKKSFIQNFPKVTWMDAQTRELAEDKVNNVDELIGYPQFITNDTLLNARYKIVKLFLFLKIIFSTLNFEIGMRM